MPTENLPNTPIENLNSNLVQHSSLTVVANLYGAPTRNAIRSNTIRLSPRPSVIPLPNIQGGNALLANTNLVLPGQLIHGLLYRGTKCVLGGSSKIGKTWILIDHGLSVASGTPFLGFNTVAAPVLYVNLEVEAVFFQQRVQAVQQSKGIRSLDNFHVWNLRGEEVTFDRLIGDLERQQGVQYALIIIDPIYKLMTGRSESSGSNISSLAANIERLIKQSGSAVVYTNHYSKGNQSKKRSIERLGGSGVYARDADTIITLTDHQQAECFTVEITERNLPPVQSFVVEKVHPLMVLRPRINPAHLRTREDDGPLPTEVSFARGLLDNGPMVTDAWQGAAIEGGLSVANFLRIRQILESTGQVFLDGENGWRLIRVEPPAALDTPSGAADGEDQPRIREAWRVQNPRPPHQLPSAPAPQAAPPPEIRRANPPEERILILGDL